MDNDIYEVIRLSEYGSEVLLTYSQTLNFNVEDSLTIKYIMTSSSYSQYRKINPYSDYLDCYYHEGIQTCNVSMEHFKGKESGYYYTYHLNHLNDLSIYYDSTPFNVIIRPNNTIVIRIRKEDNKDIITIGKKGTLYFKTNYNDTERNIFNISDIEEKTSFEGILIDKDGNKYNTKCRLWKPNGENLRLFCNLKENLIYYYQEVSLNLVSFNHNNFTIIVKFENPILVEQLNYEIPFIYSDKQYINITDGIEYYNFNFNSDAYNNDDLLYIYSKNIYISFDYCNKERKELICQIKSSKLEENLGMVNSNMTFELSTMNEKIDDLKFHYILEFIS